MHDELNDASRNFLRPLFSSVPRAWVFLLPWLVLLYKLASPSSPNLPSTPQGAIVGLGAWAAPVLMSSIALGVVAMCIVQLTKETMLWREGIHARTLRRMGMRKIASSFGGSGVLDLPTEKLAGQVAALAQNRLVALAVTGKSAEVDRYLDDEILKELLGKSGRDGLKQARPDTNAGDQGSNETLVHVQTQLEALVQQQLDRFQIRAERSWRIAVRFGAISVSASLALLVTPLRLDGAEPLTDSLLWVCIIGVSAGIISGFVYDLLRLPASMKRS